MFCLIRLIDEAGRRTFQVYKWVGLFFRCFAGSESEFYVKSVFTNVPIREAIDYILDEIYVKNKLPEICSKLILKRLL